MRQPVHDELEWLTRALRRQALVYRDGSTEAADDLVAWTLERAIAEIGEDTPISVSLSSWLFEIMRRRLH